MKAADKSVFFKKTVVIGIGLMGTSLARDLLKNHLTKNVVGLDRSRKNLKYASQQGFITDVALSPETLQDADLVVLSIPVLNLLEVMSTVAPLISPKALVIDLGSTKSSIGKRADQLFQAGNFVGCHPMAGREKSGPQASVEGLFDGAPCIIVPGRTSKKSFVNRATKLWQAIGARTLVMDAAKHDRYVAACSHLPHVLSFSLVSAVGRTITPKDIQKIAGNSFKSYSRIAGSDAKMWADIFLDNQSSVLSKITEFRKELLNMERMIKSRNAQELFDYMDRAAKTWRKL